MQSRIRFYQFLIYACIVGIFTLGCTQDESGDKKQKEFRKVEPTVTKGELRLQNSDFARFEISADNEMMSFKLEVRQDDTCFFGHGSLTHQQIENEYDSDGQYRKLDGLMVQISPIISVSRRAREFVHLIVDKNRTGSCSESLSGSIDDELLARFAHHRFLDFNLTDNQLKMASPQVLWGSNSVAHFSKTAQFGLIFDISTNEIIGVSIPKERLKNNFFFGTANCHMQCQNQDNYIPVLLTREDADSYETSDFIYNAYVAAIKRYRDLPETDRSSVLAAAWFDILNFKGWKNP